MVYVGRCVSIILVAMTAATAQATGRVTQSFDFDWHFKLGEDAAYNKSFQGTVIFFNNPDPLLTSPALSPLSTDKPVPPLIYVSSSSSPCTQAAGRTRRFQST